MEIKAETAENTELDRQQSWNCWNSAMLKSNIQRSEKSDAQNARKRNVQKKHSSDRLEDVKKSPPPHFTCHLWETSCGAFS